MVSGEWRAAVTGHRRSKCLHAFLSTTCAFLTKQFEVVLQLRCIESTTCAFKGFSSSFRGEPTRQADSPPPRRRAASLLRGCGVPPHHPPAPSASCAAAGGSGIGASQRQTVAVGPSRPTGPLRPTSSTLPVPPLCCAQRCAASSTQRSPPWARPGVSRGLSPHLTRSNWLATGCSSAPTLPATHTR